MPPAARPSAPIATASSARWAARSRSIFRTLGDSSRDYPARCSRRRESPDAARAAIYALLLSGEDQPTRQVQWQLLQQQVEPPLLKLVQQLSPAIDQLPPESRLPVADMAVPRLKRLSPAQYAAFRQVVEALTAADGRIDLFEYCLRVVLFACLDVQFGLRPAPAVRYKSITAVAPAAAVVLSALAYAGQSDPSDVQRAFQAGAERLGGAQLLPPRQCTFDAFDAALGSSHRPRPR